MDLRRIELSKNYVGAPCGSWLEVRIVSDPDGPLKEKAAFELSPDVKVLVPPKGTSRFSLQVRKESPKTL
jgi:hypothetical protein